MMDYFDKISSGTTQWGIGKEYTEVIQKLNTGDQEILKKYIKETVGTTLFAFLGLFEDFSEFKIKYEKDDQEVDLVSISEMLKAEPTIENGWIDRFSKVLSYNNIPASPSLSE